MIANLFNVYVKKRPHSLQDDCPVLYYVYGTKLIVRVGCLILLPKYIYLHFVHTTFYILQAVQNVQKGLSLCNYCSAFI